MSKRAIIPKHCLHRRSGRGYVQLNGTSHYTDPWGSEEAEDASSACWSHDCRMQWTAERRSCTTADSQKVSQYTHPEERRVVMGS